MCRSLDVYLVYQVHLWLVSVFADVYSELPASYRVFRGLVDSHISLQKVRLSPFRLSLTFSVAYYVPR